MILPGLSGGTMAFIMGIYEKLIGEIAKIKIEHIKKLFSCLTFKKREIRQSFLFFRTNGDWPFLIPLAVGLICSGILFIALATPWIKEYSLQFYSLVCGLVMASLLKPFKEMKKTRKNVFIFLISFVINFTLFAFGEYFSLFSRMENSTFFIFLPVGFLTSSALIIPGLSGSYLLVLFGLYEKTLLALKGGELPIIICFLFGSLAGIFLAAKGIGNMLRKYFNESMAVILGLILSSLYATYPLPKKSLPDILLFDTQKKVFLLFFIGSFIGFIILSFLYERKKSITKSS